MNYDPEIIALNNVYEVLRDLNQAQINRIINWLKDKFGLDLPELISLNANASFPASKIAGNSRPTAGNESEQPETTYQNFNHARVIDESLRKDGGARYRNNLNGQEYKENLPINGPSVVVRTALPGFMKFEHLEDVFDVVKVKKGTEKVLITAAFLQEGKNNKELSSYDISSNLKRIGTPLVHVSGLINSLMTRTPPYLVEIGKYSYGKHGRRKFRVTEDGLKAAHRYIN